MSVIKTVKSIPFTIIFALITIAMSVDIYVPNLPQMTADLHTNKGMLQFSISIAVFGSSIVTFLIGPLSDAYGRRQFMIIGQVIFALAAWASAFVTTIDQLLILRLIQGSAGSIAFALTFAIISDVFQKSLAPRYYAYTTTAITMSLVAAPIFGGIFGQFFTWRYCFGLLGLMGTISSLCLYFNLPETLAEKKLYNFMAGLKGYKFLLYDKRFIAVSFVPSVLLSLKIAFFSVAAFYFIRVLGDSSGTYGAYQGCIMLTNATFSLLTVKAIQKIGRQRVLAIGMSLIAVGTCCLVAACLLTPLPHISIVASIACYAAGLGFSWAVFLANTMEMYPQQAGLTSSLSSVIRGSLIGLVVSGIGMVYEHSFLPVAIVGLIIVSLCMIIYYWLYLKPNMTTTRVL